jgi:Peptidase family M1 domain
MVVRGAVAAHTALAVFAIATSRADAADPGQILAELRAAHLAPERAVLLRDTTIDLGAARLVIEQATVVPAAAGSARPVELALSGQLRFLIEPPDEVEAAQLELFTGRRSLDVAVSDVVVAIADPHLVERLLRGPPARPDAEATAHAAGVYGRWREGAERRRAGVEMSLVRALVGDATLSGYVAVWCHSDELGAFLFESDPEDPEALTLASFVPVDVRGWDRRRLARNIRSLQRKGRFLALRVEDLGAWDIWLSGAREEAAHGAAARGPGFESRHYDLDVTVKRKRRMLDGSARVTVEATSPGRTTVVFDIHSDLRVLQAHDEHGAPLPFVQIGPQIAVVLREAPTVGTTRVIQLRYTGRALQWVGRGVHDLVDTDGWYPHTGAVDRATYDVRLRWPRGQELLASGQLVDSGLDGNYRWEHRRIDRPAIATSFVLGDLRVESRRIEGTALRVGFDRAAAAADREKAIATIASALEFLERTWGELPVDELTVVVLPRDYAQSYLGFVTLNDSLLESTGIGTYDMGEWVREVTIAHELAHQWWGNVVGWASYRDQWLSESMANYTALLYWAERTGRADSPLGELVSGWRDSLERLAPDGRTVESLGPVVLGHRLNSSKAIGYQTVVYRKGAVILAMLARAVGPERFHEALRSFLADDAGRVLSTADFLDELGRAAEIDLDGFARTFVYGTGIPDFSYTYAVERAGDHWLVRGEARRRPRPRPVVRIERDTEERWDVVRDLVAPDPHAPATLRVPFRIVGRPANPAAVATPARATAVEGELMLRGDGRFEVETDLEPATFELDPKGEVLARFATTADTARTLRLQAEDRMVADDLAGAEDLLRRALDAASADPPAAPGPSAAYRDALARREQGRLRAALARVCLDQGRLDEARAELEQLESTLANDRGALWFDREVLAARIDLEDGKAADAYQRLRRLLGRNANEAPRVRADLAAEGWSLLAVAAHAVGEHEIRSTALAIARSRGADVRAFAAAIPAEKP